MMMAKDLERSPGLSSCPKTGSTTPYSIFGENESELFLKLFSPVESTHPEKSISASLLPESISSSLI